MQSGSSQARRFQDLGRVRQKKGSVHKKAVATAPIDAPVPVRGMATFSVKKGKEKGVEPIDSRVFAALLEVGIVRRSDIANIALVGAAQPTEQVSALMWWDGSIRTAPCNNITGQMRNGVITVRWSGPKERLPPALASALDIADVVVDASE